MKDFFHAHKLIKIQIIKIHRVVVIIDTCFEMQCLSKILRVIFVYNNFIKFVELLQSRIQKVLRNIIEPRHDKTNIMGLRQGKD
jgi:hypothetical protein